MYTITTTEEAPKNHLGDLKELLSVLEQDNTTEGGVTSNE